MAIGSEVKLSKSLYEQRIWRLWSGSEVITINQGVGGDMIWALGRGDTK